MSKDENDFEQLYYNALYKIKQLEFTIKSLTETTETQNTINGAKNNKDLKKTLISEIIRHRELGGKKDFKQINQIKRHDYRRLSSGTN